MCGVCNALRDVTRNPPAMLTAEAKTAPAARHSAADDGSSPSPSSTRPPMAATPEMALVTDL